MRRRTRSAFAAACLSAIGLAALSGGGAAPPAMGAGAFPGQGFLPDNRAWEMVSPADKNGGYVVPDSRRSRAAADGSAIGFISLAAFGDAIGTGVATDYIGERSTDPDPGNSGWSTHAVIPKQDSNTFATYLAGLEPFYDGEFSADLQRGVFFAKSPVTEEPYVDNALNLYRREDLRTPGAGSYQLVTQCPLCADKDTPLPPLPDSLAAQALRQQLVGASPDLEHLIFESQQILTEDTPAVEERLRLYEWDGGVVRLAGRIPSPPAVECDDLGGPACEPYEVSVGGQGDSLRVLHPHTVSDGSDGHTRVFFTTPTNPTGTKPDPGTSATEGNVYVRTDGTATAKLNASERFTEAPDTFATARYLDAAVDGGRAFFKSNQALTDDAPADGISKLYMYDTTKPATAPDNLTFLSVDEELADSSGDPGRAEGVIGVGEDGAYVYFVAQGQLVSGEPLFGGSSGGIYLWHEGALSYVGPSGLLNQLELVSTGAGLTLFPRQARVTPDGKRLLFSTIDGAGLLSRYGGADYDHGACGSLFGEGCRELYLYDAEGNDLTCVSCKPSGAPATTVKNSDLEMASTVARDLYGGSRSSTHETKAISDDGRYVFFSSAEKLLAGDTNGVLDAYVFDTATGAPRLLSSGEDSSPSWFIDATPDGSDAFIVTREQLSGWDVGSDFDLYDARIGGGFPEPPPPPPSCVGDACQPAPLALSRPTPGTATLSGPGNQATAPKPPRPRCPEGKRRVKARGGKSRCVKRHERGANGNRRAGR